MGRRSMVERQATRGLEENEARRRLRALTPTLLWIGLVMLTLGAGWLVFDQMTASHVLIVNRTPDSIQMTLSGRGFRQTVSVAPSSERAVRLKVTADTSLRISATASSGRTYGAAAGYFTRHDGQTAQVVFEGTAIQVTSGE